MALIPLPSGLIQTVEWTVHQPGQVTQSPYTGRVKAQDSGHAWHDARVTWTTLQGSEVFARRRFLVAAGKKGNTFRLGIVDGPDQSALTSVLVKGAGQSGYSLITDGWGAAGTKLVAGQYITVGDQAIMLAADAVANGSGEATLALEYALRVVPADNAAVEVKRPWALMRLSEPRVSWSVSPGTLYGASFACEEAF